ncbi:unnamed protein product [Anisakis simplex]|uniref:Histone H3 n=1 Tax=Anisakis simplex TaxID=6269 RepID=A0A0M3K4L8_ANISI|nr:unnamed protein product [Anisakis simplex]
MSEVASTEGAKASTETQTTAATTAPSTVVSAAESGTKTANSTPLGRKGRRKKKREQLPEGFEQWSEEDQKYYQVLSLRYKRRPGSSLIFLQAVSALLRDVKATRRQCSMRREWPSRWRLFRMMSKGSAIYPVELEAFRRAKETFTPVDKNEQLDLDF